MLHIIFPLPFLQVTKSGEFGFFFKGYLPFQILLHFVNLREQFVNASANIFFSKTPPYDHVPDVTLGIIVEYYTVVAMVKLRANIKVYS